MTETELTPRQPDSRAHVLTPELQGHMDSITMRSQYFINYSLYSHLMDPVALLFCPQSRRSECTGSDSALVTHKLSCETDNEDNNENAINNLTFHFKKLEKEQTKSETR